jgi:DNA polymerase-3 subunit epsilon
VRNILGFRKYLKEKKDISMPDVFLRNARFVVVDTELTGLDEKHDSIISIGAVRMEGGRIELSDTFYRLANPNRRFEPKSVVIHGITPSEVIEEPCIDLVLAEFLEYCGNDILVGYCVDIDMHFINKEMSRIYGLSITNPIVDIYYIYEWLKKREIGRQKGEQSLPILSEGKLYNIAAAYGISLNGAHNAMVDAFVTSQVFQRFMPLLVKKGIETVGDLMRIGRLYKGGDTFSTALEKSSY